MADNPLPQLKQALTQLSQLLDTPAVSTALGQIPDSLKTPVVEGLKQVLDVIKNALDELKTRLGSITSLNELFGVVDSLLTSAEGLAPAQRDTIQGVKSVVNTLKNLPGVQEIEEILGLITQIVQKLDAL